MEAELVYEDILNGEGHYAYHILMEAIGFSRAHESFYEIYQYYDYLIDEVRRMGRTEAISTIAKNLEECYDEM